MQVEHGKEKSAINLPCTGQITHENRLTEISTTSRRRNIFIEKSGDRRIVTWPGGNLELTAVPWRAGSELGEGGLQPMKLTMPGKVLKLNVKAGDTIKQGDCLAVVEAMKMENNMLAVADARVKQVHAAEGDRLEAGAQLISFEAIEEA